jgi:hypothetical protein
MTHFYSEADLEGELERLYRQWGELGYWARRFHQMFSQGRKKYVGGVTAARRVVCKGESAGFEFLRSHGGLDLTVERLVLKRECDRLFDDGIRRIARAKLTRNGLSCNA